MRPMHWGLLLWGCTVTRDRRVIRFPSGELLHRPSIQPPKYETENASMIGYIEGKIIKKSSDRVLILANQVGYEVLLPAFVMDRLKDQSTGDTVNFFIYHHQTEHQPKPVLIGFSDEMEKDFFQQFITVDAIGPLKAVKALTLPVRDIADFIETKNIAGLRRLSGIGGRTAEKIVAALSGKVGEFAHSPSMAPLHSDLEPARDFTIRVLDVLVTQLGHKPVEAKRMIMETLQRNPSITTPEALIDAIYRGEGGS